MQPPLLAAVEAAGAPPVRRLSYSSLESYRRCGYRFYLERVARLQRAMAKLADAAGEPVPATLSGAASAARWCTSCSSSFDFARPALPSAEEVAERLEAHGVSFEAADLEDIRGLVERFAGSELRARLAAAAPVRSELPFAFTLPPARQVGREPARQRGGGRARAGAGERIRARRRLQERPGRGARPGGDMRREVRHPEAHLRACGAALGAPTAEVVHLFLERPDEPVIAAYSAAPTCRALERELLELAEGVIEGRFEPTADPHRDLCATCPGRARSAAGTRAARSPSAKPPV